MGAERLRADYGSKDQAKFDARLKIAETCLSAKALYVDNARCTYPLFLSAESMAFVRPEKLGSQAAIC